MIGPSRTGEGPNYNPDYAALHPGYREVNTVGAASTVNYFFNAKTPGRKDRNVFCCYYFNNNPGYAAQSRLLLQLS
jgi:hypothetical protein